MFNLSMSCFWNVQRLCSGVGRLVFLTCHIFCLNVRTLALIFMIEILCWDVVAFAFPHSDSSPVNVGTTLELL